ncbi:MAG: hypothetical protein WC804_20745 [Sphingomonas sp.]|jgi:NADPH2 dehydrogenase|uniref:oxidoreductase n=1 Tax=Sphingomonas sp. TaxID=28214 RepID=UPI0035619D85
MANLADRPVFFLGVNTGFVRGGLPDARFVEFYARRSSPRLRCAIVGNVVVPGGYGSNAVTPSITSDAIWGKVASAITGGGSHAGIQLATAWEDYVGSRSFVGAAPTDVITSGRRLVSTMTPTDISKLLNGFDAAADLAMGHGFRHVQLHAAHGYLLSLLIDSRINPGAGFVLSWLWSFAERLAQAGIETSIRISLKTGEPIFDAEGKASFQDTISRLPFTYIDLSSGFYNIDKRLIYPARPQVLAQRREESVAVALRHPQRLFILSGRALSHDWRGLPQNMHLGICRDLIANPDVLSDPRNGCENHGKCHYFSRGESHLTCARWKSLGLR